MTLPVSMDDYELFPKDNVLNVRPVLPFEKDLEAFSSMQKSLEKLWWSRLIIAVRGYVVNYVNSNDETLFHCDDVFISLHRFLAEGHYDAQAAYDFVLRVARIAEERDITRKLINCATEQNSQNNPFNDPVFRTAFEFVVGKMNTVTMQIAISQLPAFVIFTRVFATLQNRWKIEKAKKKGIRFETDPEWDPDEKVVLFQQFGTENRTWVLLDFDRYILAQWKPKGTSVIFGDRFVEKKKRLGHKLCASCGMIEQHISQFYIHNNECFCSKECFDEAAGYHGVTTVQI